MTSAAVLTVVLKLNVALWVVERCRFGACAFALMLVVITTVDAQLHMHRSAVEATALYHIIEGILLKP